MFFELSKGPAQISESPSSYGHIFMHPPNGHQNFLYTPFPNYFAP